jgi:hypothetical protein
MGKYCLELGNRKSQSYVFQKQWECGDEKQTGPKLCNKLLVKVAEEMPPGKWQQKREIEA